MEQLSLNRRDFQGPSIIACLLFAHQQATPAPGYSTSLGLLMEPKSLLLEAQQVTVMYSQVGVGDYFTLPRNTHSSWFCFAPASSFLASCTKSISLQAAFLACWTLFFPVVFSFTFFLATSSKEPPAPDWASLCLPPPGGAGLTNLPVLSLQYL